MRGGERNPQVALGLRCLVAGYLVHLSFLIDSGEEHAGWGIAAAAVLFAAGGIAFCIWAVLQYRKERKRS